MKLAVLFHRFGPYHWARLQATGRRCELYGIETSSETKTYDWERVKGSPSFEHFTVYPSGDIGDLPARQISELIEQTLKRVKPDVVAVHGWARPDALAATSWCARTATPSVVMSDSTRDDFRRNRWKELIKTYVVQMHQAGFVGGEPHVSYLARLGMSEEQITVGYDVVDNRHFAVGAAKAREEADLLRQRLDLPTDYFLASCRFIEEKNIPRLLSAFSCYQRRSENPWDLVILGDGPLKEQIIALRNKLHLVNCVHLPGFKQYDDLPAYYGLANAFVHPSTKDTWGLVVNEAMAVGLPVLISERCGCVRDLVQEGENGFTFDPYDTVQLASLMTRMSGDGCDRSAMGARSRAIISEWTPERFAEGLLAAAKKAKSAVTNHSGTVADTSLLWVLQRV
jgi:glycosyltransferase involved in cell wall biosynthesis